MDNTSHYQSRGHKIDNPTKVPSPYDLVVGVGTLNPSSLTIIKYAGNHFKVYGFTMFFRHFTKGDNFRDFLYSFLADEALPRDLL